MSSDHPSAKPTVDPVLLAELHRIRPAHAMRMLLFAGLYATAAAIAVWLAGRMPEAWVLRVPFYVLSAASLHGISLFVHEGVHGVLARHRRLNHAIAVLCALPVCQNYAGYRVLHLRHHAFLGAGGDPDHYANYTAWSWLEFLMHWARLLVGYLAYVIAIPLLGYRHGNPAERRAILAELALMAGVAAALFAAPIPGGVWLHGWLIPMVLINTMVNIRGMSQHTWLDPQGDAVQASRSILTNPVTRFFMCNENFHLEHHLFPGVPWYNLPRLHEAIAPELAARQAPFIRSYAEFVRTFVRDSIRLSPLGAKRRRAGRA